MTIRVAFAASAALNLVLGCLLLLSPGKRGTPDSASGVTNAANLLTAKAKVVSPSAPSSRRPLDAAQSQRRTPPVDWRQVESGDYREYIANLRAIGCPEKTIRDIVIADVNDLYASKAEAITRTNEYRYWKNPPVTRSPEQQDQLNALEAQKWNLFKTLGLDMTGDFNTLFGTAFHDNLEDRDLELTFLDAAKRQQFKDLQFEQARQELIQGNNNGINQQTEAKIQALLTSDEYKEYQLRTSVDAAFLRGGLEPVNLTESEFRAVYDIWENLKAFPADSDQYKAAQQSSEAALQQLLGPDRFKLFLEGAKTIGYRR